MTKPEIPELEFGRFFLPGPTEVHPEILAAQVRPVIGHRGEAMKELMRSLQPGLRSLFRTQRPVYVSASSATGLMEAAVRNVARGRVLSLVNGAFSDRFHRIATACGLEADRLEVPWGEANTPEALENALIQADYDTVTVVHSETSTGVLNPIADLARVAHEAGDVAIVVDSVSGLGGAPVEADGWALDFVLTGSQKSLALPPGIALGVAQDPALERSESNPTRGVYFDFLEFEANVRKDQTPNTPAVSLLYALLAQLERIGAETVEGRWQRHEEMAQRTWAWVDAMSDRGVELEVLAPEAFRSPTVTCIRLPEGKTGPAVCGAMLERGYTIAPGYGKTKEEMIRIGHMGDHTLGELNTLLAELEEVLVA